MSSSAGSSTSSSLRRSAARSRRDKQDRTEPSRLHKRRIAAVGERRPIEDRRQHHESLHGRQLEACPPAPCAPPHRRSRFPRRHCSICIAEACPAAWPMPRRSTPSPLDLEVVEAASLTRRMRGASTRWTGFPRIDPDTAMIRNSTKPVFVQVPRGAATAQTGSMSRGSARRGGGPRHGTG